MIDPNLQFVSLRQLCERFDLRLPGGKLALRRGRKLIREMDHGRRDGELCTDEKALLKWWACKRMPPIVKALRSQGWTVDPVLPLVMKTILEGLCEGLNSGELRYDAASGRWSIGRLPVEQEGKAA